MCFGIFCGPTIAVAHLYAKRADVSPPGAPVETFSDYLKRTSKMAKKKPKGGKKGC